MTYKLLKDPRDGRTDKTVLQKTTGFHIPCDPGNRHYQEYLEWVNAGNTPEAAD